MNRRSFLKRLVGKRPERVLFAVQVVLDQIAREGIRSELHALIAEPAPQSDAERHRFYRRFVAVLLSAEPYFEYGYWEYVDDDKVVRDSFREWVTEIEASLALEAEETGSEEEAELRIDTSRQYIACSIILAVRDPLDEVEPYLKLDDELLSRQALGELLGIIPSLDFSRVEADAVYLAPGNEEDGFSSMDLADEGWAYLLPLS